MTNPHDFEGNHSFTWIPFYMEMAEKLLEYKDNRDELIKIVYGMDRQFINYIKDNGGNDYPDIIFLILYFLKYEAYVFLYLEYLTYLSILQYQSSFL